MLMLFVIGIVVGAFGSLLGLGGGILLIPLITTFLDVPIKTAIGTSALCVVATSNAAGAVYVGRGLTHNRLAMVLEVATTAGAFAGNISGLLGIGGGIIKVPIMSLVMGVPLRASIATSNFMIGITAATSAIIYYARGFIDPILAVPTALGVVAGAQIGTRLGGRLKSEKLKLVFQLVMLLFAINMFYQALNG
jgi:uncharacterized membrane protein YfcA